MEYNEIYVVFNLTDFCFSLWVDRFCGEPIKPIGCFILVICSLFLGSHNIPFLETRCPKKFTDFLNSSDCLALNLRLYLFNLTINSLRFHSLL